MKLLRFGPPGAEKPGLIGADGIIRDLSKETADIDGAALSPTFIAKLAGLDPTGLPVVDKGVRIGACIARPGKIVGVGLNYSDHAVAIGAEIPTEPTLFLKAASAICGPNDDIIRPPGAKCLDWEVELGIVIGIAASHVSEQAAPTHIAGYCVCNDVSERSYQFDRGGGWDKGKSYDTFAPIGPWLVTANEIDDPLALSMWLEVNGRRYQRGSTSTMIFAPAALISYISQFMTLAPGDIVMTGTPPGVGMTQSPKIFLEPGDVVSLGVTGLGEQRQTVVSRR